MISTLLKLYRWCFPQPANAFITFKVMYKNDGILCCGGYIAKNADEVAVLVKQKHPHAIIVKIEHSQL